MTKCVRFDAQSAITRNLKRLEQVRIDFAEDVLERQDAWKFLNRILHKVDDGWHVWEVDDLERVEGSSWYQNRAGDRLLDELLKESALRAVWSSSDGLHSRAVLVTYQPSEETWELVPEHAAHALADPLRIVVEDRESDGLFLGVVVKTLGPQELVELYENEPAPLSVQSPGGRDKIIRHLKADLAEFDQRGYPGRIFVLIDSDAPRPEQPGRESKKIVDFCKQQNISHHRLKKRAIENYVPGEALEAWARKTSNRHHEPAITRLERLSRTQRDHLPKSGFFKGTPEASGTLYDDLSDEDKKLLCWNPRKVKPFEESLKDHQDQITARNLRERCGPRDSVERHELDDLLTKVMERL